MSKTKTKTAYALKTINNLDYVIRCFARWQRAEYFKEDYNCLHISEKEAMSLIEGHATEEWKPMTVKGISCFNVASLSQIMNNKKIADEKAKEKERHKHSNSESCTDKYTLRNKFTVMAFIAAALGMDIPDRRFYK